MCYVHNQWYDISCATLYVNMQFEDWLLGHVKMSAEPR